MRRIVALAVVCVLLTGSGYVAYLKLRAPRPPDAQSAEAAQPQKPISGASVPGPAAQPSGQPAAADASSPGNDRPPAAPVRWLNIAAAAVGGRIERITSDGNEEKNYRIHWGWSAAHLIEGGIGSPHISCAPICGWASKDATPQEIVLSFYQQREAVISRVVIDTLTGQTREDSKRLPRQVEIAVSRASADDGFTPVASVELPSEAGLRPIDFAPVPAKYLRVRILSNYGAEVIVVGELS